MKNLFFVVLTLISLKQHAQNSAINLIKDGTITGTVLDKGTKRKESTKDGWTTRD